MLPPTRRLGLSVSAICAVLAIAPFSAVAGTFADIYNFTAGADGAGPWSPLVPDRTGNLYSSTTVGGTPCPDNPTAGCGVIFRLDALGGVTTLHTFMGGADGSEPETGMLLYRNTLYGSANGGSNQAGVFFSVNSDGSGYTVLHQFSGKDGYAPVGSPQLSSDGGLIGVTGFGGPGYVSKNGFGVLYRISRNGEYRVIHNFTGGSDGKNPSYLVRDASGNIFGSTYHGGDGCAMAPGCGTIFEFNASTQAYSVIYNFTGGTDGSLPVVGAVGPNGVIYGSASGGMYNHGTLFSLAPSVGGKYAFNLLVSLKSSTEGDEPKNPLVLSSTGALVGSTATYMYAYQNGFLYNLVTYGPTAPIADTQAQFTVVGDTVEGPSVEGGIIPCLYNSQVIDVGGCGFIFTYAPRN